MAIAVVTGQTVVLSRGVQLFFDVGLLERTGRYPSAQRSGSAVARIVASAWRGRLEFGDRAVHIGLGRGGDRQQWLCATPAPDGERLCSAFLVSGGSSGSTATLSMAPGGCIARCTAPGEYYLPGHAADSRPLRDGSASGNSAARALLYGTSASAMTVQAFLFEWLPR